VNGWLQLGIDVGGLIITYIIFKLFAHIATIRAYRQSTKEKKKVYEISFSYIFKFPQQVMGASSLLIEPWVILYRWMGYIIAVILIIGLVGTTYVASGFVFHTYSKDTAKYLSPDWQLNHMHIYWTSKIVGKTSTITITTNNKLTSISSISQLPPENVSTRLLPIFAQKKGVFYYIRPLGYEDMPYLKTKYFKPLLVGGYEVIKVSNDGTIEGYKTVALPVPHIVWPLAISIPLAVIFAIFMFFVRYMIQAYLETYQLNWGVRNTREIDDTVGAFNKVSMNWHILGDIQDFLAKGTKSVRIMRVLILIATLLTILIYSVALYNSYTPWNIAIHVAMCSLAFLMLLLFPVWSLYDFPSLGKVHKWVGKMLAVHSMSYVVVLIIWLYTYTVFISHFFSSNNATTIAGFFLAGVGLLLLVNVPTFYASYPLPAQQVSVGMITIRYDWKRFLGVAFTQMTPFISKLMKEESFNIQVVVYGFVGMIITVASVFIYKTYINALPQSVRGLVSASIIFVVVYSLFYFKSIMSKIIAHI